ncbi:MAG TPA: hypothetical protein VGL19_20095 [Polyangiaceae bacterium]
MNVGASRVVGGGAAATSPSIARLAGALGMTNLAGRFAPGSDATGNSSEPATGCGCKGKAGCAVWDKVYVTWFGFNDNSCLSEGELGCNDIANPGLGPKRHRGATEGTGSYDDPITAAASNPTDPGHGYESFGGVTLTPGMRLYNPEVKKYFIMEDACLECGDEYACKLSPQDTADPSPPADCVAHTHLHIDFWMGPRFAKDASELDTCEGNSTLGSIYDGAATVIVNPPEDLPVAKRPLYADQSGAGGCWTPAPVSSDGCR